MAAVLATLTYAAGVCSGNSIDSPSLNHRTMTVNSHHAHSGAPLPSIGQSSCSGSPGPTSRSLPSLESYLPTRPTLPSSHGLPLTPHLQVIQLISPKGGTDGCQLWLSGNHCPAKRQPRGPSACIGSPSCRWAPGPTVGRKRQGSTQEGQSAFIPL